MSKCSKCGAAAKGDATFCKSCGSALSKAGAAIQDKKSRVMSKEHTWIKPAAIAVAVVVAVAVLWAAKGMTGNQAMNGMSSFAPVRDATARLSKAMPVRSEGGDIRIPVASVGDGNAHFFSYGAAGKTVTFFVMQAADGSIRTAYDACMACNHAKLGYRQEGVQVVCNNCGMGFKPTEIGKGGGGCNPIPVNRVLDGPMIVLKAKDLESGTQYF